MSNNENYLCSALDDATIKIWNVQEKNTDLLRLNACDMTSNTIPEVQTNAAIVSFGSDFKEDVQQLKSYSSIKHFNNLHQEPCMTTVRAHGGTVYGTCFTSKDDYLLSCSEDTTIRLWDIKDFTNKAIYNGHSYPVFSIASSDFDLYFASGSYDCTAKLWTFDRTFPIRAFAGHQQPVQSIAFHSNVSYLATADTSVRLWDISSGKTVRLMTGHWAPVMCLSFSPNGRWLASAGEDTRIRVWDIASGSLWKEMRGHAESVYGLQFSPDSSLLSSCGADSCVRVWNVKAPSTVQTTAMDKADNPHLVGEWTVDKFSSVLFTRLTANNLLKCISVQI
uniref:TAF5-like RNA polymerase II p300/CBP-associated factor-associated factor 65 kDa subunit 5L n=1 Tax=Phallusia mammillata TaxID=59560 RepID=A0A6F9DUU2_9ASCI|nr:TAF5-like RNA polymerase II p300/CBP-associated factor-associated factor 65 kDa subunit 5L [Phallusia mammillata]